MTNNSHYDIQMYVIKLGFRYVIILDNIHYCITQ
jgi:hypothetical protein